MAVKYSVIVALLSCAICTEHVLAQPSSTTRAESLIFTVIDFRVPALQATFADALRHELAAHSITAKIREINFVSCELSVRAIDECVVEAIATKPTLIYATTTTIAMHTRRVNPQIPIIFSGTADPRQIGLVDRLDRPGNNLTGFSTYADTFIKRLEILKQSFPKLKRVHVLLTANSATTNMVANMLTTANSIGLELKLVEVSPTPSDAMLASAICDPAIEAFDVPTTALLRNRTKSIASVMARCGKPAIYSHSDFVKEGALMSYGPEGFDYAAKTAEYVRRVLNTTNIGDIPIEFSTKFTLSVNLDSARALSNKISPSIFKRADKFF
jgi:putative tryptophan/tyrosine transport system substrate-binding protein